MRCFQEACREGYLRKLVSRMLLACIILAAFPKCSAQGERHTFETLVGTFLLSQQFSPPVPRRSEVFHVRISNHLLLLLAEVPFSAMNTGTHVADISYVRCLVSDSQTRH